MLGRCKNIIPNVVCKQDNVIIIIARWFIMLPNVFVAVNNAVASIVVTEVLADDTK